MKSKKELDEHNTRTIRKHSDSYRKKDMKNHSHHVVMTEDTQGETKLDTSEQCISCSSLPDSKSNPETFDDGLTRVADDFKPTQHFENDDGVCDTCIEQGRQKEREEILKILYKEKENQHNKDCIICWNLVEGLIQEIKEGERP